MGEFCLKAAKILAIAQQILQQEKFLVVVIDYSLSRSCVVSFYFCLPPAQDLARGYYKHCRLRDCYLLAQRFKLVISRLGVARELVRQ